VHKRWNILVVALGIAALASGSAALADHGGGKHGKHGKHGGSTQVFTLDPSTHGNPEGVATRGGGKVFFVGATGDGTIYRGTVGNPTVTEFIPGAAGKSAVGMKVRGGKLYVAGGMTGKIYVYSLRTKELLATFDTGSGGFLNDLVVTGKGSKQRSVYLTTDAREALEEYLAVREDACMALFVNFDRAAADDRARRLTSAGARFIVRKLRVQLGAWSFKSPHVARHTAATTLLEVTGGDVRLVQEVLGHANLNTLQGYTKIVDSRKQDAYRRYQEFLDGKKAGS